MGLNVKTSVAWNGRREVILEGFRGVILIFDLLIWSSLVTSWEVVIKIKWWGVWTTEQDIIMASPLTQGQRRGMYG